MFTKIWGGPLDGGMVPPEEIKSCGKFIYRTVYRTVTRNGGKSHPRRRVCYAVHGRTSKYRYDFIGYDYEPLVKQMMADGDAKHGK